MDVELYNYFGSLAKYSKSLLDKLPISKEPQPLEETAGKLFSLLKEIKDDEVRVIRSLWKAQQEIRNTNVAAGLNTIGLLTDRLTILLIKEWCLRNKNGNEEKATELYNTQIKEIITAICFCQPGFSSINTKITNLKVDVNAKDWHEVFYQLLAINIVLWESQEILYVKDIKILPSEELRAYIEWFAIGNMQRNILIDLCERHYWSLFKEEQ